MLTYLKTTKYAPYKLWMGYIPRAHQPECVGPVPKIEEQKEQLEENQKSGTRSHEKGAINVEKR